MSRPMAWLSPPEVVYQKYLVSWGLYGPSVFIPTCFYRHNLTNLVLLAKKKVDQIYSSGKNPKA